MGLPVGRTMGIPPSHGTSHGNSYGTSHRTSHGNSHGTSHGTSRGTSHGTSDVNSHGSSGRGAPFWGVQGAKCRGSGGAVPKEAGGCGGAGAQPPRLPPRFEPPKQWISDHADAGNLRIANDSCVADQDVNGIKTPNPGPTRRLESLESWPADSWLLAGQDANGNTHGS